MGATEHTTAEKRKEDKLAWKLLVLEPKAGGRKDIRKNNFLLHLGRRRKHPLLFSLPGKQQTGVAQTGISYTA